MNHLEHKLAGLEDVLRDVPDFKRVRALRIRREPAIDEDGNEHVAIVPDDIGIGYEAMVVVDGEKVSGKGRPRAAQRVSLDLFCDLSPRQVGELIAPSLQAALQEVK